MVSQHTKLLFGASVWVLFASGTFLHGVEGSHESKFPFQCFSFEYFDLRKTLTRTDKFLVVVLSEVLSLTQTLATTWKNRSQVSLFKRENYDLPILGLKALSLTSGKPVHI